MKSSIAKTTCCAALVASALATMFAVPALASSHREAPFITSMPKVDGTDLYMFRSYEDQRSAYTTLIANYAPLQDAYGGPNYFAMDADALYEIHINNNGNGREQLTYQFRFKNENKNTQLTVGGQQVSIPLVINGGAITAPNAAGANVRETYTVKLVTGDRRTGVVADVINADTRSATFEKPLDNIGNKSIPDYPAYAAQHVVNIKIPNCELPGRMFVGQRKDPFVVNLGETFDLINIKSPISSSTTNTESAGRDDLADKNVTSIELEIPTVCLTSGSETVIGAWTTASVRQGRLINPTPNSINKASKQGGAWTQVSRLGAPLVNEVVIGLKDKDQFNHSMPIGDGQFATYVTNPTLPALVEILFGSAGVRAPTNFPRTDLVAAFLTGVPGVNQPANVVGSEMLRLNTSIAPTASTAQLRLGVIAGDNAGFPNGRRPGDDVVDIALRVVMGRLCVIGGVNTTVGCKASDAPSGSADFTDGAFVDYTFFDNKFPYLKTPLAGSLKH